MKRLTIFLSGAAILIATGISIGASPLQAQIGAWTVTPPMNSARSSASSVLLQDGRILVTGGNDSNGPTSSAEFFAAQVSYSLASPMNVPRSGHVAVVLQDGRVLVAGGTTNGGEATNSAEIFDPIANTWTNVTSGMIEARSGHSAALLHDGRVLIAGGANGTQISSTLEVFDPNLGVFTASGVMASPRTQYAMTVLHDGRALIVGGNNGIAPVASTDIFDPVAGTVSPGPVLSVARFGHSATTLLNGQVAVIGGNNGNADPAQMDVTPSELFDPAAAPAFITLATNLATPREGHLAFLLPNNNSVLIVGGSTGGSSGNAALASAELFTPQQSPQGIWTYLFGSTGSMSVGRIGATGAANQVSSPASVMQANGVLLVAGGADASGSPLNSSEVYGFATIQTDQGDYAPGTNVAIMGSGWQPGETVTLQLVESPLVDPQASYSVIADANGNISNSSFTTDSHDINVKFTLSAIGSVSRAQTTFTDSSAGSVTFNNTNSVASGYGKSSISLPMIVTPGGANTVAFATIWVDEGSGAVGTTFNVAATYAGRAMTSVGAPSYDYNYAPMSVQVFYLVNPPTGTNTLAVSATASSGTIQEVAANLISFNGVSQTAPVRQGTYQTLHSANGVTVGSFTATISSNASDLTLGALENTFHFATPASNQTVDGTGSLGFAVGSDHSTTPAATVSDTWSFTNPYAFFTYVGFSIQAAAGGIGTPTPLIYTANPVSRPFGAANPAFAGTITGFLGTDTQGNSTSGTLTFTSPATAASGVGSYPINGSGLTVTNGNYTFAQAAGNLTALTITKATPTVTVTGGTFTYDGNPHAATATAVGVDGHTPVNGTFSFVYTPSGNSTVPTSTGTYSVVANFTSSDPNYNNATGSGSITITSSASATVAFNNRNSPVAAFGKSTLSAPMSVNAGGANAVAFATVWVDEGSGTAGTTFNVTATYGGQTMTSAGPTSYDYNYAPISSQVFYLANPPTGTNTLVVNATASSGTIQEVSANLISFNGVNQFAPVRPGTYQTLNSTNGTVGGFTATIASNANDLTLGLVEQTFHFATTPTNQISDGVNAADFAMGSDHSATGASSISDTWSFTNPYAYYAYVGFSIQAASGGGGTPTPLVYTASPVSRAFGAANPPFTGTVTGFLGSDTLANSTTGTLTFSSPATSSSSPGSYAINGSGLTSVNGKYTFVQAGSNATALTITPPVVTGTTYYLIPAASGGNDSNNGLSLSSPWQTPHHAVNCGDVIIASIGTYSGIYFTAGEWGNVSCPAGNNVAWLKCATFDGCKVTSTPGGSSIWVDSPYWGVQGWEVDGSNNTSCFSAEASPDTPVTVHHVIFANNIAINCGTSGFGSTNLYGSTTASADYVSIVGNITYNTASAPGICGEDIEIYQPILSDSNPGTHFFIDGNFAMDGVNATSCNGGHPSDGNGIILDTFNGSAGGIAPYTGQSVVENNIVLFNGARGLQIVQNSGGNIYFKQNTVYGDNTDPTQGGFCGEIISNVNTGNTVFSGNIAATSAPTTCNGSAWWDYIIGNSSTALQITSGIGYSPVGQTCESIDEGAFSCSSASLLSINPNFSNPINPGAPNCSTFTSVPACMATVIADYTPTNPSAAGYGYQIPSSTPVADPLFPKWLCNVNLPPGLVTMGCN